MSEDGPGEGEREKTEAATKAPTASVATAGSSASRRPLRGSAATRDGPAQKSTRSSRRREQLRASGASARRSRARRVGQGGKARVHQALARSFCAVFVGNDDAEVRPGSSCNRGRRRCSRSSSRGIHRSASGGRVWATHRSARACSVDTKATASAARLAIAQHLVKRLSEGGHCVDGGLALMGRERRRAHNRAEARLRPPRRERAGSEGTSPGVEFFRRCEESVVECAFTSSAPSLHFKCAKRHL